MKLVFRVIAALGMFVMSLPAFAEEAASQGGSNMTLGLGYLGAGLAIGLAVLGGGTGQGRAAAGALDGIARNPQSADKVFTPLLISLALIEFQAIMAFIVAILLVTK